MCVLALEFNTTLDSNLVHADPYQLTEEELEMLIFLEDSTALESQEKQ